MADTIVQIIDGDTVVLIEGADLLAPYVTAAQAAQAGAELAEQRANRIAAFYFSPSGTSGSAGTRAAPWSYAYLNDPTNPMQPGDIALADWDGVYNVASLRLRKGGSSGRPITWLAAPGRSPILDWREQISGWTLIDPTLGIWESNEAFAPGVTGLPYSGNIKLIRQIPELAQWYPLGVARGGAIADGAQMTSPYGDYLPSGLFNPGAMIERVVATGKFLIRLNTRSAATMLNKPTTQPTDPNPNNNDIAISLNGTGLRVEASNIIMDGIVLQNSHQLLGLSSESLSAGAKQSNITLRNGADYPTYQSFNFAGIDNFTVHDWVSDGGLRPDWWISYIDVKGGATPLERVRRLAIPGVTNTGIYSVRNALFYRWTCRNFFDGAVGVLTGMSFGLRDPTDPNSDEKAWANRCNFIGIWDDMFQIYSNTRLFSFQDCFSDGAGIARDGSTGGTAAGLLGIPKIRRCLLVATSPIFYGEAGAIDGSGTGPSLAGFRYPATLSSHGLQTASTSFSQPWDFQDSTVVFRFPNVATGDFQLTLKNNDNHEGEKNVLANNIFIITGVSTTTGNNGVYLTRDLYLGKGREIIDGNIFIDTTGNLWGNDAAYNQAIIRNVYVNGSLVTSPNGSGTGWYSFGQLRANASVLAASQIGYSPGIQSVGEVMTGIARPLDTLVDPVSYRPVAAGLKSGAVDLTNAYPDLGIYRPQFGARSVL